jgi:hypothetical protein
MVFFRAHRPTLHYRHARAFRSFRGLRFIPGADRALGARLRVRFIADVADRSAALRYAGDYDHLPNGVVARRARRLARGARHKSSQATTALISSAI